MSGKSSILLNSLKILIVEEMPRFSVTLGFQFYSIYEERSIFDFSWTNIYRKKIFFDEYITNMQENHFIKASDAPWKHFAKWNKPVTKRHILYESTYMRSLEWSDS